MLRRLERETAGEDPEPAKHRLFVGRQQSVAPLQRRAQRLVPAQHDAGAGGEDVEPFVQPRAQALHAQQWEACGRKLDGQRNAIQSPADLDDRMGVLRRQREARVHRLRPRHEQLHGARLSRIGARVGGRHGERAQAIHVLVRGLDRLLAGDQHAQARRRGAYLVEQGGDGVRHVLAVVEHQQESLWREYRGQGFGRRPVGSELRVQHARDGGGDQRAVRQRRQLDPPDAVREFRSPLFRQLHGHGLRNAGLADAARAAMVTTACCASSALTASTSAARPNSVALRCGRLVGIRVAGAGLT